ncbi:hypothetical protein [Streptomyces sp. JV180]|uniref:hypothetical protein n=1 Tax=Streptomyces sp. JV180 TaxID=858634 RepID=UPI00168A97E8|nr:hypothetical protein [Streptomyces sp. JV180]MBD3546848.1 hypothetical protein [Streptomyces sp. JV180]
MDAAMLTALGALLASPVAAAAAIYGSRGAARASREGTLMTGYDSLTARLAAERDKAEADQAAAERRAEAREAELVAEIARLRLMVTELGGTP